MPSITPKDILKFLKSKGFYISRQSGSHIILHNNSDKTKQVTLPIHNKDLNPKTLSTILKQAGIDKKELFNSFYFFCNDYRCFFKSSNICFFQIHS